MSTPSLSHAIGSMTLITIMILVGAAFSGIGAHLSEVAVESQLGDVAEYVASDLVSLMSILNLTQGTTLVKELSVPAAVGGQGYTVRLGTDSGYWVVMARLDATPRIRRNATLPWKSMGEGSIVVVTSGEIDGGEAKEFLYSGAPHPVVWGRRSESGSVELGLGVTD